MAEEKGQTEVEFKGRSISFDDAVRFFDAVENKDAQCPFCSSRQWYVHMADSKGNSARVVFGDSHGDFTSSFRAIQVTCSNCGFIRLHLLSRIADWLSEQEKGGEEGRVAMEKQNVE